MKQSRSRRVGLLAMGLCLAMLASGCATTRTIDPDSGVHYDASYDFSDKKEIVDVLSSSLTSSPAIVTEPDRPILVVYGIANETSEHINTGGITDNEADYQYAGFVPPEERIAEGRQLGANYILSGTLRSIEKKQPKQIRLSKRKLVYYSMNLEVTDLETSEIVWADNVEIARESSKPIIGW